MLKTYKYEKFEYFKPVEIAENRNGHYPIVVVGAGPVGLSAAIDLAKQGLYVLLLDNDDTVSIGSRGVCYAKRTLEILDRIGSSEKSVNKGTSWNVGRTFFQNEEVFNFNLSPQDGYQFPGMINLQQYYLEQYLIEQARQYPNLEIRFKNNVINVIQDNDLVTVRVETPDGAYTLQTDWLIAADGARSPIRQLLGLDIEGKIFMDRFLIADVVMAADYPAERWFWFDPPFHPNQSVLLHKQSDNVWRIDFQLGWDADPDVEKRPENVIPRIKAMLAAHGGEEREFELEWVSVYTFQCRRMNSFNHNRVLFVGDAAHQVSPFGARGANSGIQDTDNLVWKLNLVINGQAPASLLDTYSDERCFAADENILNSTRSTDFITPKSKVSKVFRDAVLDLATDYPFARVLVNSGRLSAPCWLTESRLNTPDEDVFVGNMIPGAPMDDAPLGEEGGEWFLSQMGNNFQLLHYIEDGSSMDSEMTQAIERLSQLTIPIQTIIVSQSLSTFANTKVIVDYKNYLKERYDLQNGTTYLIRPDQHIAARWRKFDESKIIAALACATDTA